MVISHKHRYLFVEIPLTGSWAVRSELCAHYDGSPILHKHATYAEFRRHATADELRFFVFGTVRHPMDEVVSRYFKLLTDHKGVFSDPRRVESLEADPADRKKYEFVRNANADFEGFFLRYHRRPFGTLVDVDSDRYDRVMRYEHLQNDFASTLERLGIRQVRPVPVMNATQGKRGDWASYYTDATRPRAQRVFGPFMAKWGYTFPHGWPAHQPSHVDAVEFRLLCSMRTLYMSRFRYDNGHLARAVRLLRARVSM